MGAAKVLFWGVLVGLLASTAYLCVEAPLPVQIIVGCTWVMVLLWLSKAHYTPPKTRVRNQERFSMDKVPENIDAIVIGSGMSGMTTAAVLARTGKRVLVLEQHYIAGGGCHMFDLEGYHFDSGLHYVVPWCETLLHLTCGGKEPPVQFDLLREEGSDVFDRIVLGDRPPFLIRHHEKHLPELFKMFPENEKEIKEYLKVSEDAMKSLPLFALSRLFPQWAQKIIGNLFLGTFRKYAGKTGKEVIQGLTTNKHLASLLGGLWIDTGGLPDRSTFLLSAAVFRGLPHEGGAYPRGGSQNIIDTMIPVIEEAGGKVLCRAPVEEILVDKNSLKVTGVRVCGREIKAPLVISSCGYPTTFEKLIPEAITQKAGIKRQIPVEASPGFLMCNVGIRGKPSELGVECSNVWYHPVTTDDDMYKPIEDFYEDPSRPFGVMITFPSMKDRSWEEQHPDQITCQMLVVTNYDWFKNYSEQPSGRREEEYKAMKKEWERRCLEILFRFYPKVEGKIEVVDVSTPLTIEYYLNEPKGGAVGLNPSPERYSDWELVKDLDIVTPIQNLYMTGQDTLVCGQPCVQIAGLITALRILGPIESFSFLSEGLKVALAYLGIV